MQVSSATSWKAMQASMHHSNANHCNAPVLHYLDTHTFLDPDSLELVLHNFAFFLSLIDFGVSFVSLCSPLQLVCFLTCTAGHVWYKCEPLQDHNRTGSSTVCSYAQVYDYG